MSFGWSDAIRIGSSVLGFLGQEETNQANAQQADKQMEFQREMSSTAYQRAVTDMKAAGLNPMLAYSQGGATTPGGAMATMQNSTASAAANASQVLQQENVIAQTDNVRADSELKKSQALVNEATVPKLVQDTLTGGHSASQIEAIVERLREENKWGIGQSTGKYWAAREYGERYRAEGDALRYRERDHLGGYYGSEASAMRQLARSRAASALLDELGAVGARREADINASAYGAGRPLLRDLSSFTNSAASAVRGLRLMR